MPLIDHMTRPFDPATYYHVYNRSNGPGTRLFFNDGNYHYFKSKLLTYGSNYWDLYAYALLPDHFHILIKTHDLMPVLQQSVQDFNGVSKHCMRRYFADFGIYEQRLEMLIDPEKAFPKLSQQESERLQLYLYRWLLSERLRRCMLGFSKAINKQQRRYGSLFQKVYRRKAIKPGDATNLVLYMHRNPIHHGIAKSYADYKHTSYSELQEKNANSHLSAAAVLKLFGGLNKYLAAHQSYLSAWEQRPVSTDFDALEPIGQSNVK